MYAVCKLETVSEQRCESTLELLALTAGAIRRKTYLHSRDLIGITEQGAHGLHREDDQGCVDV